MSNSSPSRDRLRQGLTLFLAPMQPAAGAFSDVTGIGHSIAVMSQGAEASAIPAGYAFSIWGVIFTLGIVYAVWQWLPTGRDSALARRAGWPIVGALALNVVWMLTAEVTREGFHLVLIILGVLGFATAAFLGVARGVEAGAGVRWLLRPFVGLFAGWVAAACFANVAGALKAVGGTLLGLGDVGSSAVLVLLASLLGAGVLRVGRGDPWYAGAVLWALVAILVANAGGREFHPAMIVATLLGAGLVGAAAWTARSGLPTQSTR